MNGSIRNNKINKYSTFGSVYIREQIFSNMKINKNKARSRITK